MRRSEEASLPLHTRVSEESELRWYEVASAGVSLWMPMMLITPICVLQFSVLYIICFASPQYLFASGEWLLPNSASNSLSVMKSFATVLMLGQIAEEFHEISESIKVLRQSRLSFTSRRRLCCCWLCISLQYLLALMVMVTSGQVILGRQNPIEPLWMTYYVFMTLSFDNMLVKFIMYVRTMERHTIWKVEVSQPETPTSKKRTKRLDVAQQVAVLWVPLLLAASVSIFCRLFNVLPITLLRYGPVANEQQVVMFSSLSLPAGCCPSVAQINTSRADTVSVSVPCLSPEAPEDWPHRPLVYWVASASHKAMPTSLQVREGRTGDGSRALLAGHVEAKPLELWSWMSDHGYEATDIDAVLRKLNDETLGIGLYRRTFAYVAEIQVHPFPWFEEVAIYAIARNDVTGALSPKAAVSNVIHGKRPHWPRALELCNILQLEGLQATTTTYNTFISSCDEDGTWQNALHGVRGTGVECDIISCSLVGLEMLGACLLKDREMQTVSLEADVISFNASISACGRNSQWRRAMHLVHAARHGGGDSTVVTCNAAMSACEVSGFWQNALQLFQDLQEDDQPDIISYCALISASICFKTARSGKCDMVLGHFPPRCVPLTHRKALEWPMALHLLNQMRHSRQGSLVATNAAISACEKCGRWEHALALLKDLDL
eukprot:g25479.t1